MLNDPGREYLWGKLERDKGLIFSAHKYPSKLLSGSATEVIRQKRASPPLNQVSRLQTSGREPWTEAYYKYSYWVKKSGTVQKLARRISPLILFCLTATEIR